MIPVSVLWLLLVLFLMHDLEEALWLPGWLKRNRGLLEKRFPVLARRLLTGVGVVSRKVFAAMAAEELVLLLAVTLWAQFTGYYYPWLALFLAFAAHLFVHIGQALAVGRYVPAVATSLVCLPVAGRMLQIIINSRIFSIREFVMCGAIGVAVTVANLLLIHTVAARRVR